MYAYKGKDANRPKRPMSAYFLWLGQFREKMKGKFAENKDLLRAAGEEWKKLSDIEKKPFEAKAEEERKNYEVLMREYHQVRIFFYAGTNLFVIFARCQLVDNFSAQCMERSEKLALTGNLNIWELKITADGDK